MGFEDLKATINDSIIGLLPNAEKKELKKQDIIEIPFGARDSELQEEIYYIPKGFHAEIEGNKVVIKQGEQKPTWSEEDENRFKNLIYLVEHSDEGKGTKEGFVKFINRLKSLRPKNQWKPSDEQLSYITGKE